MSCVSPQRSVGPVVCFESVIAAGRVCVCAWLALDAGVSMLGHSGDAVPGGADAIRDSNERLLESCGRSHHRLQVSSSRALPPVPTALRARFEAGRATCKRRARRQHRAWGSDLRSERVRGAEGRHGPLGARQGMSSNCWDPPLLNLRPRPPLPLPNPRPRPARPPPTPPWGRRALPQSKDGMGVSLGAGG